MLHGILRSSNCVSNRPWIGVDFVIVAASERLVAKEVDGLVLNARDILFSLDVLQTVCLVPTGRKDVKGNLATNRVSVSRKAKHD